MGGWAGVVTRINPNPNPNFSSSRSLFNLVNFHNIDPFMYFSTFDIEQATGTYEDMHLQSCKTDFCMVGGKSVLAFVAAGPCTCLKHLYRPSAN